MSKEAEYREHAERARAIAGQLKSSERAKLLKIAEEWDSLASDHHLKIEPRYQGKVARQRGP